MLIRLSDRLTKALLVFSATLALLLAFVVCIDVIGRGAFGRPLQGTKELVEASIVIICFLQVPYAIRSGGMIYVDFVVQYLSPRAQSWLATVGALLGAGFLLFIVWGSYESAWNAWAAGEFEGEGALRVPAWPARLVVVVGCLLGAFSYLVMAARNAAAALHGTAPPPPPALT